MGIRSGSRAIVPVPARLAAILGATAGVATPRSRVHARCVRLEGDDAAAVTALVSTLAPETIVEQAGVRYAVAVRPIYPDEGAAVTCPGS
jgi:hypothetical protein